MDDVVADVSRCEGERTEEAEVMVVRGGEDRLHPTIEDPQIYTRPWKITMPLYRRLEKNAQLVEYKCVEFAEELMYGHLVKGR